MKADKYNEIIEGDIVINDADIVSCVLSGKIYIKNCRIIESFCRGTTIFSNGDVDWRGNEEEKGQEHETP